MGMAKTQCSFNAVVVKPVGGTHRELRATAEEGWVSRGGIWNENILD